MGEAVLLAEFGRTQHGEVLGTFAGSVAIAVEGNLKDVGGQLGLQEAAGKAVGLIRCRAACARHGRDG